MHRQSGLSSRQFVSATIGVLALLVLVALLVLELNQSHQRDWEMARQEEENLARLLDQQLIAAVGKIDIVLQESQREVTAHLESTRNSPAGGRASGIERLPERDVNLMLARKLALIPESQSLRVAGADGRMLFDATGIPAPVQISDRAYFRRQREVPNAGLVISEPIFARVTSNWVITLSRRITLADGSFGGLVQAAVNADQFGRFFQGLSIGKRDAISLYDNSLNMVSRYPAIPSLLGKPLRHSGLETELLKGESSGFFQTAAASDGEHRLYYYRRLANLPWVVVVGKSTADIQAAWEQKVSLYGLSVAFLGILLGTLIYAWQKNFRATQQLAFDMSQAYSETSQRIRALLDGLPDPAWLKDGDGRMVAVNDAYLQLAQKPVGEVVGHNVFEIWPEPVARHFQACDDETWMARTRLWHESRVEMPGSGLRYLDIVRTPVFDEEGRMTGVAGIARDVTDKKRAEERVRYLAEHDTLTDLPNRLLLGQRLAQRVAASVGAQVNMALLFFDLDHFKNINDSLGHEVGDALLRQVADRLRSALYEEDTVSRQGGDEFAILLVNCGGAAMVARIAQRLLEVASQPYHVDGHELSLTASVGISLYPGDGADIGALLKNADAAMYHAKAAGRNTYQFYTAEMNARVFERLSLENSLRKALNRQELELYFQPQVSLDEPGQGPRVVGLEALLRWRHGELGMVAPSRFIPIAEETGLILPIGHWVLKEACRRAREMSVSRVARGLTPLTVAVNLSAVQFRQANLSEMVAAVLAESGLAPQLLELEVTESVLMHDTEHAIATLRDLRTLGVKVAIDDFGTGYSSLNYLRRLPIDRIKIDQSFVREMTLDHDSAAITEAIIAIASKLHLQVIAEGVETEAQLEFLRRAGCLDMQGFYFSRPLPVDALDRWLLSRNERPQPPGNKDGSGAIVLPLRGS